MSSSEKNQGAQPGQQQYFPPPPGPPPAQTSQGQAPKHPNETPLPDYQVPAYNPANPHFAPPPAAADGDIYGATPTDERPPKFPHSPSQQRPLGSEGEGGAGKKKGHKFAALGAAFTSKVAGPVNALAQKLGSEGFLPESLDKECDKAARILRGFCKDGIYSDSVPQTAATATPAPTNAAATTASPSTTATPTKPPPTTTTKKPAVLLTIPSKVIARAQGLAIFSAVRLGLHATGSSGSGVLLARLPDGRWSPPSGIQVTSIGAGFVAGLDIFDCVIVINTREALEAFVKRARLSLGSDMGVTAGPVGAGGALGWGVGAGSGGSGEGKKRGGEGELAPSLPPRPPPPSAAAPSPLSADNRQFQTPPVPEAEQGMGEEDGGGKGKGTDRRPSPFREAMLKPVYSYVKSRGLYAGVQVDGTVIAEREGANARFYGQPVPVAKILRGEVPAQGPPGMWPAGAKTLFEVLRGAEGWHGQQGRPASPVSPGYGGYGGGNAGGPPAPGVAGVTTGVRNLNVGGTSAAAAAGPSAGPPPPPTTAAASAKAAEAAAETARAEAGAPPLPPPMYSELQGAEDLPPAYDEGERHRQPAGDSKTGLH